jgi:hypothetical protein
MSILSGSCILQGGTMGIGFSLFLFVVIILMVGGLLGLLVSALFWSSFAPWSRRRTVAGQDRVVEERHIEREF